MAMWIAVEDLTYIYGHGGPSEVTAIDSVSVAIVSGEFVGMIGHTGSGKSTLAQLLNGLLKPTAGRVLMEGRNIWSEKGGLTAARQKVGLVFQYPEDQFFEETVFEEVAFGPRNMRLTTKEVGTRVSHALEVVGLNDPELLTRSPFKLSGGQKRRVALASILAMQPELLILDEPTAGLDPGGRRQIMDSIFEAHSSTGMAVLVISHDMEMLGKYANRLIVMHEGRMVMDGSVSEIFMQTKELLELGLDVPDVVRLVQELRDRGFGLNSETVTVDQAEKELLRLFGGRNYE
jgi:energy-coupling factor transport system ATP-binding protein